MLSALGLVVAVVVALAALTVLDRHPLRLDPEDPQARPTIPMRDAGHAVALAVDLNGLQRVRSGTNAPSSPPDLEWLDLLEHEFGAVDLLELTAVEANPAASLAGRRLLVLARHGLRALPPESLEGIRDQVRQGLHVLVEAPGPEHAAALGLRIATVERQPLLPWPRELDATARGGDLGFLPAPVAVPEPLALENTIVRYAPAADLRRRARVRQSVAGRPAVWELAEGDGAWIILAPHLSEWTARMREGRWNAHGASSSSPLLPLAAFGSSSRPIPAWIDAWTATLLSGEAAPGPWPRWGNEPPERSGWLVLSVGTEEPVSAARAASPGAPPPPGMIFRPAPFPASVDREADTRPETIDGGVVEIGLLGRWPGPAAWEEHSRRRLLGIGPFHPWGTVPDLPEQAAALRRALGPGTRVEVHHAAPGDRAERPDRFWASLVDAGMVLDTSSVAPSPAGGWAWGSATLSRPGSQTGRVWELRSLPVTLRVDVDVETGAVSGAALTRLLRANTDGSRGVVHVLLSAPGPHDGTPTRDDARSRLAERARAADHRVTTASALLAWRRARATSRLHSRFDGERLHVEVEVPTSVAPGLLLHLPRHWRDRVLVDWTAEWSPARSSAVSVHGHERLAVGVPPGTHAALVAVYR